MDQELEILRLRKELIEHKSQLLQMQYDEVVGRMSAVVAQMQAQAQAAAEAEAEAAAKAEEVPLSEEPELALESAETEAA